MDLEYYGTDLRQPGHYLWSVEKGDCYSTRRKMGELPFNVEGLPYAGWKKEYPVGTVRYYKFAGFTICAISGSCSDKRIGSKSIFFVEDDLRIEVFQDELKRNEFVQKVIKQMPFEVVW